MSDDFAGYESLSLAAPSQQKIAAFKFSGTLSEADQKYLGLEKPGAFTLQDIKAPYVLIEIMRTTCPHCVAQVPALNQLYKLVANSDLKDRLKIISVGESDDASDLKKFKAAHKIPYPLVPDPDWEFCSACMSAAPPPRCSSIRAARCCWWKMGLLAAPGQCSRKSRRN